MKRGVVLFVLLAVFILLSSAVLAVSPTVSLSPSEFYETNDIDVELNVSNWDGDYEITGLQLSLPGIDVLQMVDYKGWTESFNGSLALWTDGSLATNVYLAIFDLLAKAPKVDEDTTVNTTLTLIDENDDPHEFVLPVIIHNDVTPPELSDLVPEDGSFVREGTDDLPVQVRAVDPETGIEAVAFHYVLCNFTGNLTPEDHDLGLLPDSSDPDDPQSDLYTGVGDFSDYVDEDQVCFDFTALNNGGEMTTYNGTLTVDGVPPHVSLVAPADGDLVGMDAVFSFVADDNLATMMTCELIVDSETFLENISAPDMDTVEIPSADVEEGEHTWSVLCRDMVDLEGQSETRSYTLDKTPPSIVMSAPENGSILPDSAVLEFDVADNYQLDKVWYVHDGTSVDVNGSFSIGITEWPDGPNEFVVYAEDSVGNLAEKHFVVTIDRTAPQVQLVSPEDNSTSDVHVNFTYVAQDDYDDALDCSLFLDDNLDSEMVAVSGEDSAFSKLVPLGDYSWKVQCVDDAGNVGVSSDWFVTVIDLTGPDIRMNNPDMVFRGDPIPVSFNVTDISGVEAVTAQMRDPDDNVQTISLDKEADMYTALVNTDVNSTLGLYTLKVYAVDTLNNSNSEDDGILLTYRYLVSLSLEPSTVSPSASVAASGTVVMDNGSAVPETQALLTVPLSADNSSDVVVDLVDGSFTYSFTAPASDGSYDVSLAVRSDANDQTYSDTQVLTVQTPAPSGSSGGSSGGGSGGSGHYQTVDVDLSALGCDTEWRCTAWTPCSDGEQQRTCVDVSGCSDDSSSRHETRSCEEPVVEEKDEQGDDTEAPSVIKTGSEVPEPEVVEVNATEEDSADAAGIGEASGFLNPGIAGVVKTLLVMLLMAMLLTVLYRYGFGAKGRKRLVSKVGTSGKNPGKDRLGLEDYLERRNSR